MRKNGKFTCIPEVVILLIIASVIVSVVFGQGTGSPPIRYSAKATKVQPKDFDDAIQWMDSINGTHVVTSHEWEMKGNVTIDTNDLWFTTSGSGLPFGCIEGVDETVTCTDQNTWYQVTFDTAGQSNLVTISIANEEITVLKAGVYELAITACFHCGTGNDFELMVKKNDGAVDLAPHLFQTTTVANQVENAAGSCMESLAANDRIELWVRCTDAAGKDAIFDHVSLSCVQIGG